MSILQTKQPNSPNEGSKQRTVNNLGIGAKLTKRKKRFTQYFTVFLFLGPSIVGFLLFIIYPLIWSFVLSFYKWDVVSPAKFVGLNNYAKLFFHDSYFWGAFFNTVYYTVACVSLGIFVALGLAVLLNRGFKGTIMCRILVFVPFVCSMIAVCLIWRFMFGQFGILNYYLAFIGIKPRAWLMDSRYAMPIVILVAIWKDLGYKVVVLLAGLQAVPKIYYEAAEIDGANRWQQFRHITLPMLSPIILFLTIVSVIWSFQVFEQIFAMTGGGPYKSTNVLAYEVWKRAFEDFRLGYGSAIAWMMFSVIFVFSIIQWKAGKRVHYQA